MVKYGALIISILFLASCCLNSDCATDNTQLRLRVLQADGTNYYFGNGRVASSSSLLLMRDGSSIPLTFVFDTNLSDTIIEATLDRSATYILQDGNVQDTLEASVTRIPSQCCSDFNTISNIRLNGTDLALSSYYIDIQR